MFEPIDERLQARIGVLGIGGAGCNAVNHMIEGGLSGVDFYAINTDAQALEQSLAENTIQIGENLTGGLGAGGDPEIGHNACKESLPVIEETLSKYNMVFLACGEGGGTGTGACPLIAEAAKGSGVLTVAIVTRPFDFEGPKRLSQANEGIVALKSQVDTLILIPNQRLLSVMPKETPLLEAFRRADAILFNATSGVADLITKPGIINLDFADVRTVMRERGNAIMGIGSGQGENRAAEAAQNAISSPLTEHLSIETAKNVLLNISGSENLTLDEVHEASRLITDATGGRCDVYLGASHDDSLGDSVRITVIATGIEETQEIVPEFSNLQSESHDFETPAFQRNMRRFSESRIPLQTLLPKDNLDIPTYLRRQLD